MKKDQLSIKLKLSLKNIFNANELKCIIEQNKLPNNHKKRKKYGKISNQILKFIQIVYTILCK